MATADVLALYFACLEPDGTLRAGAEFTLLCEHHEDWAIVCDTEAEIVSGKHREISTHPLSTIRQLLTDGGGLHLYRRWVALGQSPTCRLVTTAGLSDNCAKAERACNQLRANPVSQDPDVTTLVDEFRSAMATVLAVDGVSPAQESVDDVRAFFASLRFDVGRPRRDLVPDLAAQRYGRHVAERLGSVQAAEAVWTAVLGLVIPRMRDAGARVGGQLPTPFGIVHDDALASRRLSLLEVDVAARFAAKHPDGYQPLPRMVLANLMAVKMVEGGCSDNAVERADELRLRYRNYWRARRGQPSVVNQQGRLTDTLHRVVDEVTDEVRADGRAWGGNLWRSLDSRFRQMESAPEAHGLSSELMLGGVSDLANSCRAWYSDRFDAKTALSRLKADPEAEAGR